MKKRTTKKATRLTQKGLALLLVVILALGILPGTALADTSEENAGTTSPTSEAFASEPPEGESSAPATEVPENTAPPTDAPENSTPPTDASENTTPPTDVPENTTSPTDAPENTTPPTDAPAETKPTESYSKKTSSAAVKSAAPITRAAPKSASQNGLSINKTATARGDGTYDLQLTLQGNYYASTTKVTAAAVDLIFIVDRSNSMKWDTSASNERFRMEAAKESATALIDVLDANSAIDTRYRIMDFSGSGHSKDIDDAIYAAHGDYAVSISDWYTSASSAKTHINSISVYPRNLYEGSNLEDSFGKPLYGTTFNGKKFWYNLRSTNYEAVFQKFNSDITDTRDNALSVVVFMTDGDPTVTWTPVGTKGAYYDKASHSTGKGYYNSEGYGTTFAYPENVAMCLAAVEDEMRIMTADRFYAVGFGEVKTANLNTLIGWASNVPFRKVIESKEDTLVDDMNAIGTELSKLFYSDLTITDTLAHDENGMLMADVTDDATIKVTVKDGSAIVGTYNAAGNSVSLAKTNTNAAATLTARRSGDDLVLDFPDTYKLEPNYTYILSAVIKPTELAYREYRANPSYPDTPDSNTGTHAANGENGFYSNASAAVGFTFDDTAGQKAFPDPVVQLNPGKLVISKGIANLTDEEIAQLDLKFNVTLTYPDDGNGIDDETVTKQITLGQMTVDSQGNYVYEFPNLSPGTTYTVSESGGYLYGYKMRTTVNGSAANSDKSATGTVAGGTTVTVNYENIYDFNLTSVKVEKQVTGNMGDWEKPFKFTASISGETNTMTKLDYVKYSKNENGQLTAGERTKITTDTFSFTLKDNEYILFYKVPLDSDLTIGETADGYILNQVTATNLNGKELTRSGSTVVLPVSALVTSVDSPGHHVIFTNDKTVVIDTGISLDSLPYVIILAGVVAAGVFLFLRKPRNFED